MTRCVAAVVLAALCSLSCDRTVPRHGADPIGVILADLDPKLAPLVAQRDSMIAMLRRDSGTVRADSEFMLVRKSFGAAAAAAAKTFNDAAFQAIVLPDSFGTRPTHRRSDGLPWDATTGATADSVVAYLEAYGIWTHRGEGDAYFDASETALLRWVGPLLTPPTQAFLRFASLEEEHPPADDASLMISWDELGERLARTERLLAMYPEAVVHDLIRQRYHWYLRFYLRGADNSGVFKGRSRRIEPIVRASYERYVAKHGATTSGRLLRGYLDVLRANDYRDGAEVVEFVRARSGLPEVYLPRR